MKKRLKGERRKGWESDGTYSRHLNLILLTWGTTDMREMFDGSAGISSEPRARRGQTPAILRELYTLSSFAFFFGLFESRLYAAA